MKYNVPMGEKLGLYVHIPFCEKKCRYCGFLSFPGYDDEAYERYTRALCKEIENCNEEFAAKYSVDTVFIGGGTPSLLSEDRMERIFSSLTKTFNIEKDAEITTESNPNSITPEKLKAYRKAGINRLSMGAQSMDDRILNALGRVHKKEDVVNAYEAARSAGIDNINIDLMFGVPEQSLEDVLDSVEQIIELGPEHISLYGLQLEEDTIFYEEYKSGILDVPEEAYERRMYHEAIRELKAAGYEHYEISNFALPGRKCRHNLKYWQLDNYLGLGLGAHSYIAGSRSKVVDSMEDYLALVNAGRRPTDPKADSFDSPKDAMGIYVFTALRKTEGVDTEDFERRFGISFFAQYKEKADFIKEYMDMGMLKMSGRFLQLTEEGIDISNDIMSEFV